MAKGSAGVTRAGRTNAAGRRQGLFSSRTVAAGGRNRSGLRGVAAALRGRANLGRNRPTPGAR